MTTYAKTGGVGGGLPNAYLDTNLVSAIARRDIGADEVHALFELVEAMHQERISLVTSKITKEEIDKLPEEHRPPHEGVYALLKRIPPADEQWLVPQAVQAVGLGRPRIIQPTTVEGRDLGKLRAILSDETDARHVFQALKNECSYFVTVDKQTILAKAQDIESAFPIQVVSPSQLLADLTPAAAS